MTSPTPTRTPNPSTTTRPEKSSRRVAHKTPLGWLPWLLLGLLGLLVAGALLLINAVDDDGPDGPAGDALGQVNSGGSGLDGQDGDGKIAGTEDETSGDTDGSAQDGAAQDGSAQDGAAEDGAAQGGGAGAQLTADGQDLLAASGGSLADRSGQAVTGSAVVESVVSDEGFWVGSGPESRVFVFLTPQARESAGESGFQVEAGQTVQVEGSMVTVDEAPDASAGVEEAEGLSQLQQQGRARQRGLRHARLTARSPARFRDPRPHGRGSLRVRTRVACATG
jgi:hypothetical protein